MDEQYVRCIASQLERHRSCYRKGGRQISASGDNTRVVECQRAVIGGEAKDVHHRESLLEEWPEVERDCESPS